jgi:hypothetical protein
MIAKTVRTDKKWLTIMRKTRAKIFLSSINKCLVFNGVKAPI